MRTTTVHCNNNRTELNRKTLNTTDTTGVTAVQQQ